MGESSEGTKLLGATVSKVQPWHERFARQTAALLKKNVLVAIRNPSSSIGLLLKPFILLGLVYIIDVALRANSRTMRQYQNEFEPAADKIGPIPPCLDDLFITNTSCKPFAYAPNTGHARVIAENMASYNHMYGGIKIFPEEIVGLPTAEELDKYLMDNPETVLGGVIFREGVDPNTQVFKGVTQDPNFFSILPIQNAVEREIHRHIRQLGGLPIANLTWDVFYHPFAHPAMETVSFAAT
eukprot:jgi/Tetstr1/424891/TSEL_015386.t1